MARCAAEGCDRVAARDGVCVGHTLEGPAPQLAPHILADGRIAAEAALNDVGPRTQCHAALSTGKRCLNVSGLWPYCPSCCAVWLGIVPDVVDGALVLKAARHLKAGFTLDSRHGKVECCAGRERLWVARLALGAGRPNSTMTLVDRDAHRYTLMLMSDVAPGDRIVASGARPRRPAEGPLWSRSAATLLSGRTAIQRMAGVRLHRLPPWIRRLAWVAAGLLPGPAALVPPGLRSLVWRLPRDMPDADLWFVAAVVHAGAAGEVSATVDYSAHRVKSELARHIAAGEPWTAVSTLVATAYVEALFGSKMPWLREGSRSAKAGVRTFQHGEWHYDLGVLLFGKFTRITSSPIDDEAARTAVFATRPTLVPDHRAVLAVLRAHVRAMLRAVDQIEELPPDRALATALLDAIEEVRPS